MLQVHSPLHAPADGRDVEKIPVWIRAAPFSISGLTLFWSAFGINLLDASCDFFVVFDMKAEMIESGLVPRLFWIAGVQDREVHLAIGKMDRAVFRAIHLLHFEYFLIEVRKPIRLM